MSCLSDISIINRAIESGIIDPFSRDNVQPASYEVCFDGSYIYKAKDSSGGCIYDVSARKMVIHKSGFDPWERRHKENKEHLLLPGGFYIGSTKETIYLPGDLMARFEGKSSLGRIGLAVHITAGYIDPGFHGNITLEMVNLAPWPIILRDGDKIGQLSFHTMDRIPKTLYGDAGNHYQGQIGPTLPR